MFILTEVTSLSDSHDQFQTLKPWWDVLMDYLVVVMLTISLLSGTLLLSVAQVTCLPLNDELNETRAVAANPTATDHAIRGRSFNLDYQQYLYVSQVCYHKALPWLSKYFPYVALFNSLLLMASSNFWLKYPKTASKIEHFLSILRKCFELPWTTKALSELACQDFLGLAKTSTAGVCREQLTSLSSSSILDWKDREQARALFEQICRFRAYSEGTSLIYMVYIGQTIFKVAKILVVLVYMSYFVGIISSKHLCWLDKENLISYSNFLCTHNLAFILQKLVAAYLFLLFLYGIIGAYPLWWLMRQPLRRYSFKQMCGDNRFLSIPEVYNDFAFLLHMADQCDQLYSWRFAIFFSAITEICLPDFSLNCEMDIKDMDQHA